MPHPITMPGLGSRQGPKILLERPHLAMLIGAIAGEWGSIDATLSQIFNFASYSIYKGGAQQMDPMATALFANLVATSAKTDLIKTAIKLRVPSLVEEFEKLTKTTRKVSGTRNSVVHASWHTSDQYPDDLITYDLNGNAIRYTKKCLEEILEQVTAARNKVNDFSITISHAPKLVPLYPMPKTTP